MEGECTWVAPANSISPGLPVMHAVPCTCLSSQQICECGGLPPPQPLQEDDPRRLTDVGTQAFACALAAAKPADRPTLEYLRLDGQLAVGAATAAALATAPFRHVSQLSLMYGGALQPNCTEAPLYCLLRGVCVRNFVTKPRMLVRRNVRAVECIGFVHTRVVQMWLHHRMGLVKRVQDCSSITLHPVPPQPSRRWDVSRRACTTRLRDSMLCAD
jgi:hypothetical protein